MPAYVTTPATQALQNVGLKIAANQLLAGDVHDASSMYGVFTGALTQLGYNTAVEQLLASNTAQSLLDGISPTTVQTIEQYLGTISLPPSINKSQLLQISIDLIEQTQSYITANGVAGLNTLTQTTLAEWAASLPASMSQLEGVRYSTTSAHLKLVGAYCQVLAILVAIAVITGNALAAGVGGYILWHDCG